MFALAGFDARTGGRPVISADDDVPMRGIFNPLREAS
jgi:hypothetical protein